MTYLLDTNTCIQYIRHPHPTIVRRLATLSRQVVVTCDIVKLELYYGAYKSQKQAANLLLLERFFENIESLPFDGRAAEICGQIRADLTRRGTPIGAYDLQIAAIALVNNLILITHNVREFSRVDGLRFEDWEVKRS
jgi:tRNA(fMet)-specific endonuclease VapC